MTGAPISSATMIAWLPIAKTSLAFMAFCPETPAQIGILMMS